LFSDHGSEAVKESVEAQVEMMDTGTSETPSEIALTETALIKPTGETFILARLLYL
jgi:hypothetical protein